VKRVSKSHLECVVRQMPGLLRHRQRLLCLVYRLFRIRLHSHARTRVIRSVLPFSLSTTRTTPPKGGAVSEAGDDHDELCNLMDKAS